MEADKRFYNLFRGIKARCKCQSHPSYKYYGGRGIKCLWENFDGFKNDMYDSYIIHCAEYGEQDTTIDRIDVNGNYCKGNCRRATQKEQVNNTRMNVKIKFNGKEYQSLQCLCDYLGLKYGTLYKRIFLDGQDKDTAIYEMLNKKNKYKYKGVTYKGITDMCRKLGLNRTAIEYRLKIGMSLDDAISTPLIRVQNRDSLGRIVKTL